MMGMNKSFDLEEEVRNADRIGIAGHVRPDGDCVGSVLSIYNFIQENFPGKDLHAFLEPIPDCFRFLTNADKIELPGQKEDPFDLFFVVDCGEPARLGDSEAYLSGAKTICIDHHLSKTPGFADLNYIDPEASSTCELIYDLLPKTSLDQKIAECLYTGMVTDTGLFQYSSTHHSTMEAAGRLMDLGINYPAIVDRVFNEKTFAENRLMGLALLKAKRNESGSVISSVITTEDFQTCQADPMDTEGIVSQLRVTRGVQAAIFLHQNPDGSYKGSLRAKGDILNVAEIASLYHGGGHAKASGFRVEKDQDPNQVIREISLAIEEQLRKGGFYQGEGE